VDRYLFWGTGYYQNSSQHSASISLSTKPSIVGNAIHEICRDHSGQLWVGTEDGGLNK
jgi:ligand-binding sensor domain-containing protein